MVSEKPKSRVTNLSTRYLNYYKLFGYLAIISIFIFFTAFYIQGLMRGRYINIYWLAYLIYGSYLWWRANRLVFYVEFDDEFMYVTQKNHDLVIPLENIKDVNLVSLGGVYKVDLYAKELFGDKFYFKPSLLYPFNHKKKEAVVDILWANIEKVTSKKQDFQRNALHS
jgi:hypothetical protein